jgi:hypothetical protein
MIRLKLPEAANPLDWADWLELVAVVSSEHRSGIAAVERNLKRLSRFDSDRTIKQISDVEAVCADVSGELDRRAVAAGEAYPFKFEGTELVFSGNIKTHASYIFCLCLSWFGWKQRKGNKTFPRRMFEDLSKYAAAAFINGEALRFGSPRTELPASFKEALPKLCVLIGEGRVREMSGHVHAQDDSLDLIAWRDFPDRAEGKLFLVGQCASGRDWESKKRELDAEAFFDDWFVDRPPSLRGMRIGFFIPHRVPRNNWIRVTRRAGIIFDRCRIAYWSHNNAKFTDKKSYADWSAKTLQVGRNRRKRKAR